MQSLERIARLALEHEGLYFFVGGLLVSCALAFAFKWCPGEPEDFDDILGPKEGEKEEEEPRSAAQDVAVVEKKDTKQSTTLRRRGGKHADDDETEEAALTEASPAAEALDPLALPPHLEERLESITRAMMPNASEEEVREEIKQAKERSRKQLEEEGPSALEDPLRSSKGKTGATSMRATFDIIVLAGAVALVVFVLSSVYKVDILSSLEPLFPREVAVLRGNAFASPGQ